MTEREKLSASLQNYYNSQVFPVPSGGWKPSAAVKKNKRRRVALWLIFVSGLSTLFIAIIIGLPDTHSKLTATRAATNKPFKGSLKFIAKKPTRQAHPQVNTTSLVSKHAVPASFDKQLIGDSNSSPSISLNENELEQSIENLPIPVADIAIEPTSAEPLTPSFVEQQILSSIPDRLEIVEHYIEDVGDSVSSTGNKHIGAVPEHTANPQSSNSDQISEGIDKHVPSNKNLDAEQAAILEATMSTATAASLTDSVHHLIVEEEITNVDSSARFNDPFSALQQGLAIELGASYLLGWNTGSERDANGFTGYGGINFTSILGDKSSVSVGLHYFQITGLNASTKTSKVSSYAYGETRNITQITPIALHYAVLPLRFAYMPSAKHQLGAGVNVGYLLNVDATISKFEQSPMGTSAQVLSKESGYMQGFSWYDVQAAIFYRRRLGKAFAVHTEVHFGVIDSKNDLFFNLKGKERNSGIKLGLIYYLTTQHKQHGS